MQSPLNLISRDRSERSLVLAALKDGQVLCHLVNTLSPGIVRQIHKIQTPSTQTENIASFLVSTHARPHHNMIHRGICERLRRGCRRRAAR